MPTLQEQLNTAADQIEADAAKLHSVVHGGATTTVATEGGTLKSVAKTLADIEAALEAGNVTGIVTVARDLAEGYAEAPLGTEVEAGKYSAKHWAARAADFAHQLTADFPTQVFTWTEGAGDPAPEAGAEGDHYRETVSGQIWRKAGDTWFQEPGVMLRHDPGYVNGLAPSDEVVLLTLEIRHPAFLDAEGNPTAIRVVRNHPDDETWPELGGAEVQAVLDGLDDAARELVGLVAKLEDDAPMNAGEYVPFIALAFDFRRPKVDQSAVPECELVMDNVTDEDDTLEIEKHLEAAAVSQQLIQVSYREYRSTDISGPANNPPLTMVLTNVRKDELRITARARLLDIGRKPFPGELYTLKRFPALRRRF